MTSVIYGTKVQTLVLALGGCLLGSTTASANPALHPNSQKYKVTTPPAATGRAGNATLAARALLNKNGTTDFDVTTGTLDSSATAPGNISKVQLKAFNGNGDVQWTKNYNSLTSGGSLHYNFADLHRGQPVQTQTNIDKIDKRTDVVTVTGNVKLRPDLAVAGVTAPDKAVVGTHVDIAATVREINNDIGATGDCRLLVDNTQVDQALGIYVDAAGVVSCAFQYQFNTTGTHTITVTVDDVVPADYDTSNNSASTTIAIIDNNPTVYWWASAYGYSGTWDEHGEGHYYDSYYGYTHDWAYDNTGSQSWEGEALGGWSPTITQFPLQSVSMTLTGADGASSETSFSYANSWTWGDGSYSGGCDQRWGADWWNTYAALCSESWAGTGYTSVYEQRFGGDVTYHSQGYDYYWNYWYGGTYSYTYNYEASYSWGQPFTVGSQLQIAATWVDAAGTSFAPVATIPMQPQSWGCSQAWTCYSYNWGWGNEEYCNSCNDSFSGYSGWNAGTTN